MKTLVLIFHPNLTESVINKRWRQELETFPEKYTTRDLYSIYKEEQIDIVTEQKIIESYDKIVFQFPLYWFNCPPFLKKWLDDVLTYGWAYGSQSGYKMSGKKIAFAITAGINEQDYSASGRYKYTLEEILRPFEITVNYIRAEYASFFAHYDMEQNASEAWVDKSIKPYFEFLERL